MAQCCSGFIFDPQQAQLESGDSQFANVNYVLMYNTKLVVLNHARKIKTNKKNFINKLKHWSK